VSDLSPPAGPSETRAIALLREAAEAAGRVAWGVEAGDVVRRATARSRRSRSRGATYLVAASVALAVAAIGPLLILSSRQGAGRPAGSTTQPTPGTTRATSTTVGGVTSSTLPKVFLPGWRSPISLERVSCSSNTCVTVGASSADSYPVGRGLVSTDGGSSWQVASLPKGVGDLSSVDCPSPTVCVAGGDRSQHRIGAPQGVLIRSSDGGKTWSLLSLPPRIPSVTDVSCASPSWCVAAAGREMLITKDGSSWYEVSVPGDVVSVSCVLPSNCMATASTRAMGRGAAVLKTSDFGQTWQALPNAAAIPRLAYIDAIDCLTASSCIFSADLNEDQFNTCPLACQGASLATTDGGLSWREALFPNGGGATSISCPSSSFCMAAGMFPGETGGMSLAVTTDWGLRWKAWFRGEGKLELVYGGGTVQPGGIGCGTPTDCVAVGENSPLPGGIFIARSTDGGTTWRPVHFPTRA
jgi:hypothetical protein